jgi:hypothetical protein
VFLSGQDMHEKIAKLKNELREIIEPDIELLRGLLSRCELTVEKRDAILSCPTVPKKADELCWLEDCTSDYSKVKEAFEAAKQSHVVNFIIADGGILSSFVFYVRMMNIVGLCYTW